MATYAGYQRYEVPDIVGNVAKIMLAQQEQDAKRMSAEELARYRQAKLDADKLKEATKAGKEVEKDILASDIKREEVLTTVPKTGYTSVDGFGSGLATLAKGEYKAINDDLRKTGNYAQFNLKSQSLLSGLKEYKTAYTNLEKAQVALSKSEQKSPVVEAVIKNTIELFTPMKGDGVAPMGEYSESGEWIPYVLTSQGKQPVSTLNNLAAFADYKPRDLEKEMKERVDASGKYTTEVKLPNGGSKTILNPKNQQNFADDRTQWINTVMASPITAAEAYVSYVGDMSNPAIPVDKNASEEKKLQLAEAAGYKNIKDADFVEYELKDGVAVFKLSDKQKSKLDETLTEKFNNKAPFKESLNMPSSTTTNINVVTNPEEKTGKTRTDLAMNLGTEVGYKAAVSGLEKGMAEGKIANTETKKPVIVKDENGKRTGEIIYYKKIGEYGGFTKYSDNPTIINVSNPDEAEFFRIEFGEVTGASKDRNEQQATHPEKKIIKK